MNSRQLAAFALTVIVWLAPAPAASQSAESAAAPTTPWGDPDLRGVWDFRTLTPMERPDASSGNTFLTDEDAAAFRQQTIDALDADRRDNADRAFGFGSTSSVPTTSSGMTTAPRSLRTNGRR